MVSVRLLYGYDVVMEGDLIFEQHVGYGPSSAYVVLQDRKLLAPFVSFWVRRSCAVRLMPERRVFLPYRS